MEDRVVNVEYNYNGGITLYFCFSGYLEHKTYYGYTLKAAIREFRQEYGLVGKHLVLAEI